MQPKIMKNILHLFHRHQFDRVRYVVLLDSQDHPGDEVFWVRHCNCGEWYKEYLPYRIDNGDLYENM